MESTRPKGLAAHIATLGREGARAISNARFEALLFVLLLLTVAAITWQDRILRQTITLTPESVAAYSRWAHGDADLSPPSSVDA